MSYSTRPVSRSRWTANLFVSFLMVTLVGLGLFQLSSSHSRLDAASGTNGSVMTNHPHRHNNYVYNQERELFSLVTRQCSLSTNIVKFRYNATSGLYSPITQYNQYGGRQRWRQRELQEATPADHGFTQIDGAIVEMRACWCTEVFFQRPMEYCPARFDTCIVRGSTGPVQCFQTSGGHSFIRSFWPVLLFWLVALLYALMCSEPGGSAREFARRKIVTCCCLVHSERDNRILDRDLANLLERQPERAAFLYRNAIFQAHQRRFRHRYQWWNGWRTSRQNNRNRNTATQLETENDSDMYELYLQARYDTLRLKTRVFSGNDEEPSDVVASRISQSHSEGAMQASSSSSSSLNSPSRSNSNETTRGGISWIPAQFRREQVTLEEMDDEMEHGVRCAICLTRLERGDVVGDIPCRHVFHKDCLKTWLKRSNRCPLCQQQGVARLSPCTREVLHRLEEEDEGADSNPSSSTSDL